MHIPVLLNEAVAYLDPKPGENFVDCTVGMGGHALAILGRTAPGGKLLGIDLDAASLNNLKSEVKDAESRNRITLVQGNFADIEKIIRRERFGPVDGVLMDLGFSSWHLEESGRGFSFRREEPLDMRLMQAGDLPTAAELLHALPQEELERILREYGEERFSRQIASEIIAQRRKKKFTKTTELVHAVLAAVPRRFHGTRIHPATRTFQALRIAVNHELENLALGLFGAFTVLVPGGRMAVISFHSVEDRMVKRFMREHVKTGELLSSVKKPITASVAEIRINSRARSAKLRAAQKAK